jgi:hypothetical protein
MDMDSGESAFLASLRARLSICGAYSACSGGCDAQGGDGSNRATNPSGSRAYLKPVRPHRWRSRDLSRACDALPLTPSVRRAREGAPYLERCADPSRDAATGHASAGPA